MGSTSENVGRPGRSTPDGGSKLRAGETDSFSDSDRSEALSRVDLREDQEWLDVESDFEETRFQSLVDGEQFTDMLDMFVHVKEASSIDFLLTCRTLELDYLETLKLVNYMRSERKNGNSRPDISRKELFGDDQYLKPILEDDTLLYHLDELDHLAESEPPVHQEASLSETLLVEADQRAFRERLLKISGPVQPDSEATSGLYFHPGTEEKAQPGPRGDAMPLQSTNNADENAYFESYADIGIHITMIKDSVRTGAYAKFIDDNKDLFKDKLVLDVGCGTGILSLMCAKAGAREVVAIDNSSPKILQVARQIAKDNDLADKIKFLSGDLEETTLPHQEFDIIVSEWMGYALMYEGMLKTVLKARDRYLVLGGLMVPSHATTHLAALTDKAFMQQKYHSWTNVFGFNLSHLAWGNTTALQAIVPQTALVSDDSTARTLDIALLTQKDLDEYYGSGWWDDLRLRVDRDAPDGLHGFVLWFDIYFTRNGDLRGVRSASDAAGKGIGAFTTGPMEKATHWEQTFLPVKQAAEIRPLKKGEMINASLGYKSTKKDPRGLDVGMKWATTPDVVSHPNPPKDNAQEWTVSGSIV